MPRCPKCSADLAAQDQNCPFCGSDRARGNAFCPECRADLVSVRRLCPQCGYDLLSESKRAPWSGNGLLTAGQVLSVLLCIVIAVAVVRSRGATTPLEGVGAVLGIVYNLAMLVVFTRVKRLPPG